MAHCIATLIILLLSFIYFFLQKLKVNLFYTGAVISLGDSVCALQKKGDRKSKKEKDEVEEKEKDVDQKDDKETKSSEEKTEKSKEDFTEVCVQITSKFHKFSVVLDSVFSH